MRPTPFFALLLLWDSSTVFSGLMAAVIAAAITVLSQVRIDRRTKNWNLQVELRKQIITPLAAASSGLRNCFFQALVELRYHRLGMLNAQASHEAFKKTVYVPNVGDLSPIGYLAHTEKVANDLQERFDFERERYNSRISRIEAKAASFLGVLDNPLIPKALSSKLYTLYAKLTFGNTTDVDSINERISIFQSSQAELTQVLSELEDILQKESVREIEG